MKRIDVMVDIETLGTQSDSTIFQIAAVAFDITNGEIIKKFNHAADVEEDKKPLKVDGSTLKWWLSTNKDLFEKLLNSGEYSSEHLLLVFHNWLSVLAAEYDVHLWGNGILFDNKMIQHQLEALGCNYPIFFTNDRDVRTIVELAAFKLGITPGQLKAKYNDENLVAHDAYDDVLYQVRLVVGCFVTLVGGGDIHVTAKH